MMQEYWKLNSSEVIESGDMVKTFPTRIVSSSFFGKTLITRFPRYKAAENLAMFLQEKTGSVCGHWSGRMTAAEQRELFGVFLGKGKIFINGKDETISHSVKRCFGADFETQEISWKAL